MPLRRHSASKDWKSPKFSSDALCNTRNVLGPIAILFLEDYRRLNAITKIADRQASRGFNFRISVRSNIYRASSHLAKSHYDACPLYLVLTHCVLASG